MLFIRIVRLVTNSRVSDFEPLFRDSKGITLSVLLSYSVVKEPTSAKRVARLGAPHVRVKQNDSTFGERILLDAELPGRLKERFELPETAKRRELRILLAAARRVNCAGTVITSRPYPLFRLRRPFHPKNFTAVRSRPQRLTTPSYSAVPGCTTRCADWAYSSVGKDRYRVEGSCTTAPIQRLFHDSGQPESGSPTPPRRQIPNSSPDDGSGGYRSCLQALGRK